MVLFGQVVTLGADRRLRRGGGDDEAVVADARAESAVDAVAQQFETRGEVEAFGQEGELSVAAQPAREAQARHVVVAREVETPHAARALRNLNVALDQLRVVEAGTYFNVVERVAVGGGVAVEGVVGVKLTVAGVGRREDAPRQQGGVVEGQVDIVRDARRNGVQLGQGAVEGQDFLVDGAGVVVAEAEQRFAAVVVLAALEGKEAGHVLTHDVAPAVSNRKRR